MSFRIVTSDRGTNWLYEAFEIFKKNAAPFVLVGGLSFVTSWAIHFLPFIGWILNIFVPVFLNAGLLWVNKTYSETGVMDFSRLFDGFRKNASQLFALSFLILLVGIAAAFGVMIVGVAVFFLIRDSIPSLTLAGLTDFLVQLIAPRDISLGVRLTVFAYLFFVAVIVAVYFFVSLCGQIFGSGLVSIQGKAPFEAVSMSLKGCSQNWWPLTIYSLFAMLWSFAAMLTFGLGFLILIPVMQIANYLIYKDIFDPHVAESSLPNTPTFDKH